VPGLEDLAAVEREHAQVLEDQRLGDVDLDRPRRDPEQDHAAAVPGDPERVRDRPRRARHLEDDVEAVAVVPVEEPGGRVRRLVGVDDRARAHLLGEAEAERRPVGGDHDRRAGRARDPDREQPDRPAAEHGDRAAGEVLLAGREDGVPERLLERRDLRRKLRPVVPPDHGFGDGDVACESALAVDAEDPGPLAHVRVPRAALEAHPAGDVALGGDVVADGDVADELAAVDDRPRELVAERQRRLDPPLRPLVPAVDVQVGAADARGLDLDEHLVRRRSRHRDLVEPQALLGRDLAQREHGLRHARIMPCWLRCLREGPDRQPARAVRRGRDRRGRDRGRADPDQRARERREEGGADDERAAGGAGSDQRDRHDTRGASEGTGRGGDAEALPRDPPDAERLRRPAVPVLPGVRDQGAAGDRRRVRPAREAEARLHRPRVHRPGLGGRAPRHLRRRAPGEALELPRPALPQPGRGELGLGDRRPPPGGRQLDPRAGHERADARPHLRRGRQRDRREHAAGAERERRLDPGLLRREDRRDAGAGRRQLAVRRRLPADPRRADEVTPGRLRAAIAVLALAGVAVTAYLVYARYTGTRLACTTGGCETVQHSKYAKLAGIPVAVLGLAAYVAVLLTSLSARVEAAALGAAITFAGLAFAVYLIVIQVAVIDAICQWCLASDGILFLLALVY